MILTQEEAKAWAEILKGFSEGKNYQIPMVYDNDGNVIQYVTITDFVVNPQCPTINLSHNGMSEDTSLSVRQVRNAILKLEQSNLIEVRKKGMPCRIWYKIKTDEIKRLLGSKTEEQVSKVCKYCGSMLVDNSGVGATWYCMNCRKEFVLQGKHLKEN